MGTKKRYYKLWINGLFRLLGTWDEAIKILVDGDVPKETTNIIISSRMLTEAEYLKERGNN